MLPRLDDRHYGIGIAGMDFAGVTPAPVYARDFTFMHSTVGENLA